MRKGLGHPRSPQKGDTLILKMALGCSQGVSNLPRSSPPQFVHFVVTSKTCLGTYIWKLSFRRTVVRIKSSTAHCPGLAMDTLALALQEPLPGNPQSQETRAAGCPESHYECCKNPVTHTDEASQQR